MKKLITVSFFVAGMVLLGAPRGVEAQCYVCNNGCQLVFSSDHDACSGTTACLMHREPGCSILVSNVLIDGGLGGESSEVLFQDDGWSVHSRGCQDHITARHYALNERRALADATQRIIL